MTTEETTVATELRAEAHDWAHRINAGQFEALTPSERTDLRALTLTMLGWADRLDDDAAATAAEDAAL